MVELPSIKVGRWRVRDWVLELVAALLAFALAGLALLRPGLTRWQIVAGVAVLGGLLVINFRKAHRTRQAELRYEPATVPKELTGLIRAMHERLCHVRRCGTKDLGVRIVLHKVHWNARRTEPIEWEQITDYYGGPGGEVGRRTSARAGIVGRVARSGDLIDAKRDAIAVEDFRTELVKTWSFTGPEARQISADRWAWMALPLSEDERRPYGVIYLDAADPALFRR